ncbi:hypothetical protein [Poriferisphaera sp. WC338]|uniref:hypothetical protein n=1 Tax=Poriferisphaera sp. WC338 TaxID=3425129 RepID=UPI003D815E8C
MATFQLNIIYSLEDDSLNDVLTGNTKLLFASYIRGEVDSTIVSANSENFLFFTYEILTLGLKFTAFIPPAIPESISILLLLCTAKQNSIFDPLRIAVHSG